jgi:hypothetical protein
MADDGDEEAESAKPAKSRFTEEEMETFEQMDEGWTLMTKSGNKLKK